MSTKKSKNITPDKKGQPKKNSSNRARLVFQEPHIFRVKSARSLSHLQESRQYLPCTACCLEADRRQAALTQQRSSHSRRSSIRPRSCEPRPSTGIKKKSRLGPTAADIERLSRPKTVHPELVSDNSIKTPYALCNVIDDHENAEIRPPFINYGGHYIDKQRGEKRTFNSLAVHQLKHHELEEHRLAEVLRERRLRLQANMYFREMEERKARAQEIRDRAARASTEYRDNYRPPYGYGSNEN